ncbi:hypothetical protein IG631_07562 [Alternaria alternata]|nr:hypothetical protein IG631_07562 [Alternaria alternata]
MSWTCACWRGRPIASCTGGSCYSWTYHLGCGPISPTGSVPTAYRPQTVSRLLSLSRCAVAFCSFSPTTIPLRRRQFTDPALLRPKGPPGPKRRPLLPQSLEPPSRDIDTTSGPTPTPLHRAHHPLSDTRR